MARHDNRVMQLFIIQFVLRLLRAASTLRFLNVTVTLRVHTLHCHREGCVDNVVGCVRFGGTRCFAAFAFLHATTIALGDHCFVRELRQRFATTAATLFSAAQRLHHFRFLVLGFGRCRFRAARARFGRVAAATLIVARRDDCLYHWLGDCLCDWLGAIADRHCVLGLQTTQPGGRRVHGGHGHHERRHKEDSFQRHDTTSKHTGLNTRSTTHARTIRHALHKTSTRTGPRERTSTPPHIERGVGTPSTRLSCLSSFIRLSLSSLLTCFAFLPSFLRTYRPSLRTYTTYICTCNVSIHSIHHHHVYSMITSYMLYQPYSTQFPPPPLQSCPPGGEKDKPRFHTPTVFIVCGAWDHSRRGIKRVMKRMVSSYSIADNRTLLGTSSA